MSPIFRTAIFLFLMSSADFLFMLSPTFAGPVPPRACERDGFLVLAHGKASHHGNHHPEGTWEKTDENSRTQFFNQHNDLIKFNAGTIWIELVPEGRQIIST
mgnify:CR=1 FL=1